MATYKVSFKYLDGRGGTCIENGAPVTFGSKEEATAYAEKMNNQIPAMMKGFFPTWYAEEV